MAKLKRVFQGLIGGAQQGLQQGLQLSAQQKAKEEEEERNRKLLELIGLGRGSGGGVDETPGIMGGTAARDLSPAYGDSNIEGPPFGRPQGAPRRDAALEPRPPSPGTMPPHMRGGAPLREEEEGSLEEYRERMRRLFGGYGF